MEVGTEFEKEVGDYLYCGEKINDGEFRYYAKIQIEGNEKLIDSIKGGYKNGVVRSSENAIGILEKYTSRRRKSNSNNDSSKRTKSNGQIDRLYSRQSKNNNIESNTTQSIGNQSRIENNQELAPTSSFLSEKTNLAPIKEDILGKIEDIKEQKEYLKNDIEKMYHRGHLGITKRITEE